MQIHEVVCADYELLKQMLERLKAMSRKYKVRDCSAFLAKARLLMNRKAPWNKAKVHWTPYVVGGHQITRTFDASPLDAYLPAPEMPAYVIPVESVA